MIFSIYPMKDATIYDKYINQNTGLDEIIELSKSPSASLSDYTYNSRILMKYDLTDFYEIYSSVTPPYEFILNLSTATAEEIPLSYSVEVYAVSQSWEMGIGKMADTPPQLTGVSWRYRDTYLGKPWATSSLASASNCAFIKDEYSGGGTWYTDYLAKQQYDVEATDLRIRVTNIVNAWISESISNDGFIIKRSTTDEQSNTPMGTLQFFSRESHTIYPPRLEICWDDASYVTGSLEILQSDELFLIYTPNLEPEYIESDVVNLRIIAREKYPIRTYATQSNYTTVTRCLPSSSYYSITDATTHDIVIPFDTNYTKLSCDSNGNYFKFHMNSLQPGRMYKLLIKVVNNGTEKIFNNFVFKVNE